MPNVVACSEISVDVSSFNGTASIQGSNCKFLFKLIDNAFICTFFKRHFRSFFLIIINSNGCFLLGFTVCDVCTDNCWWRKLVLGLFVWRKLTQHLEESVAVHTAGRT